LPRLFPPPSLRRVAPLLLLLLATLVIWCGLTHRWTVAAWSTPLQLHGDPAEVFARVKAAQEDWTQPLRGFAELPRLAAPYGADWSRYPVSDRLVFTGLGLLARGVGVFAAVNVATVVVHLLNALAFYLCARFLRWRDEWAVALALLFTFCSYNYRWGVTVSFSLTFFVPPLLLLCAWIARSAPAVATRRWTLLALLLGAWLGGANPYLGFFATQLAAGAVLLQLARRREFARWRAGVVLIAAAAISFVLHNAAYFLAATDGAGRMTLARNFAGSEIYALKLLDLIVPFAEHRVGFLDTLGRAYQAQSALRTEFFVNYLGVFGLLGLVVLVGRAGRGLARPRAARVPDAFLGVLWTLLFSAVGGVNSLLALGGFDVFRASNRNSIFILGWSLLVLGSWVRRRTWASLPALRLALPAVVAIVGLADSLPAVHADRWLRLVGRDLEAERSTLSALEQRLGRGALVFQLPATVFPEAGVVVRMSDYEHFDAYLLSDTLRFSYGALRGTAVSRCLRSIGRLPAPMLRQELENAGFSALWINTRGLPDEGEPLLQEVRGLGLEEFRATPLPGVRIFLLHPAAAPRLPDLTDPRLYEPWDIISSLSGPTFVVFDGWYDLERDGARTWRWARTSATGGIRLPKEALVELTFRAYSLTPGQLVVSSGGREVYRQPIGPGTRDTRTIRLNLGAGRHNLEWRFTGRVMHAPTADARKLGFAIENLTVTAVP
jgi:hypothetical protein